MSKEQPTAATTEDGAVSYTHLDVYKRQTLARAAKAVGRTLKLELQ